MKPLNDVLCFIETYNEDGTDASKFYKDIIEKLGGTVETTFSEDITHLIWSKGKNIKRLKMATALGIFVVSPLWIDQCKQAKKKVSEDDFIIDATAITESITAISNGGAVNHAILPSSLLQSLSNQKPASRPPSITPEDIIATLNNPASTKKKSTKENNINSNPKAKSRLSDSDVYESHHSINSSISSKSSGNSYLNLSQAAKDALLQRRSLPASTTATTNSNNTNSNNMNTNNDKMSSKDINNSLKSIKNNALKLTNDKENEITNMSAFNHYTPKLQKLVKLSKLNGKRDDDDDDEDDVFKDDDDDDMLNASITQGGHLHKMMLAVNNSAAVSTPKVILPLSNTKQSSVEKNIEKIIDKNSTNRVKFADVIVPTTFNDDVNLTDTIQSIQQNNAADCFNNNENKNINIEANLTTAPTDSAVITNNNLNIQSESPPMLVSPKGKRSKKSTKTVSTTIVPFSSPTKESTTNATGVKPKKSVTTIIEPTVTVSLTETETVPMSNIEDVTNTNKNDKQINKSTTINNNIVKQQAEARKPLLVPINKKRERLNLNNENKTNNKKLKSTTASAAINNKNSQKANSNKKSINNDDDNNSDNMDLNNDDDDDELEEDKQFEEYLETKTKKQKLDKKTKVTPSTSTTAKTTKISKITKTKTPSKAKVNNNINSHNKLNGNILKIGITGFDDDNGERNTILNVLKSLYKQIGHKSSSSSSSSSNNFTSVIIDEENGNEGDDNCTCVVAAKDSNKRSLRIVFALVKGVPIVTEEWVFASMCSGQWENYENYYHPRYKHLYTTTPSSSSSPMMAENMNIKNNMNKLFVNESFCLMRSTKPQVSVMVKLLTLCGAEIVKSCSQSTYMVFGESRDFVEWLNDIYPISNEKNHNNTTNNKNKNNDDILHALQLANDKHVITSKFIFDSIEAGILLDSPKKGLHFVCVPAKYTNTLESLSQSQHYLTHSPLITTSNSKSLEVIDDCNINNKKRKSPTTPKEPVVVTTTISSKMVNKKMTSKADVNNEKNEPVVILKPTNSVTVNKNCTKIIQKKVLSPQTISSVKGQGGVDDSEIHVFTGVEPFKSTEEDDYNPHLSPLVTCVNTSTNSNNDLEKLENEQEIALTADSSSDHGKDHQNLAVRDAKINQKISFSPTDKNEPVIEISGTTTNNSKRKGKQPIILSHTKKQFDISTILEDDEDEEEWNDDHVNVRTEKSTNKSGDILIKSSSSTSNGSGAHTTVTTGGRLVKNSSDTAVTRKSPLQMSANSNGKSNASTTAATVVVTGTGTPRDMNKTAISVYDIDADDDETVISSTQHSDGDILQNTQTQIEINHNDENNNPQIQKKSNLICNNNNTEKSRNISVSTGSSSTSNSAGGLISNNSVKALGGRKVPYTDPSPSF